MQKIWQKIYVRTTRFFYYSMLDFVRIRDLTEFEAPQVKLSEGARIVPFTDAQIPALCSTFPESIVRDFAPRSLKSQGFVAFLNDRAVGYIWATVNLRSKEGEAPFLYDIRPAASQSYLYDLKVTDDARGSGLGMQLMITGMLWAKQLERRSMIFTTGMDNQAVHRLTAKLGFKDVGTISFKRICQIRFANLDTLLSVTSQGGAAV